MVEDTRRDRARPDDAEVTGQERWDRDQAARDVEHQLTAEEQKARQTEMRRRIEAGQSDDEAWEGAVRDVRERNVPIAREGEEGSRRGKGHVQANERTTYEGPDTVPDDEGP